MLPSVSVIIPAFNYEQYVGAAIDSVLAQGYPQELLEVVVVDDGSSDATAAVVRGYEERHPGTVRLLQQPNSGPEIATNTGLAQTSGELVALLDADDMWMPGKLLAQVAVLQDRPEVNLVFGDMQCVGADGEPLDRPPILSQMPELKRRSAAQVLHGNVASTSAITMRRSIAAPVPPEIPIADWWFTLQAALSGEIAWIRPPVVRYRIHGGGRSSGRWTGGFERPRLGPFLRDVRFKLGAIRTLDLSVFSPLELAHIWEGLELSAGTIIESSQSRFTKPTALVEVDEPLAADLLEQAQAARAAADHGAETRLLLQSLAWDPYQPGVRTWLHRAAQEADRAYRGPEPLAGSRRVVMLGDAEELLGADEMLDAYAEAIRGSTQVTLAIDATRMPQDEVVAQLSALVGRRGLQARDDVDLLVVVGQRDPIAREHLHRGTVAYYRRAIRTADAVSATMEFTPASLPRLRALIDQALGR